MVIQITKNNNMSFNELVKQVAYPILKDYNFHIKEEYNGFVEFAAEQVSIRFTYDSIRSKDMIVYIKYNDMPFASFNLIEYYHFLKESLNKDFEFKPSKDMEGWIKNRVDLLQFDSAQLLTEDIRYYQQIADYTSAKANANSMTEELEFMQRELKEAWQNKDYPEVIKVLEPFKEQWTKSMKMKYEYSVKRVEG